MVNYEISGNLSYSVGLYCVFSCVGHSYLEHFPDQEAEQSKGNLVRSKNNSPQKRVKECLSGFGFVLKGPQFVDIPLEEEDSSDEEYHPDEEEEDETAEDVRQNYFLY